MADDVRHDDDPDVDWFWDVVEKSSRNRDRLREILGRLPKDAVYKFQDLFLDFAAELQDEPYRSYLGPDESEDGLEDAAQWVVSQGRVRYEAVLTEPGSTRTGRARLARCKGLPRCGVLVGINRARGLD